MVRITLREKPPNDRFGLIASIGGSNQIAAGLGRWVRHCGNAAVMRTDAASLSHPSSQTWQPKASSRRLEPNVPLPVRASAGFPPLLYRPMTKIMGVRSSAPPMA